MARCLLSSLRQIHPLLREVLELEGYDVVEATAHAQLRGLQAADVALPEGVTLDIGISSSGDMGPA